MYFDHNCLQLYWFSFVNVSIIKCHSWLTPTINTRRYKVTVTWEIFLIEFSSNWFWIISLCTVDKF